MTKTADFSNFLLKYTVHKDMDDSKRGHTAIYCDYQNGEWFYEQLIDWTKRHIPAYALSPRELENIDPTEMIAKVELATKMIYGANAQVGNRGEIGEIILHGLIYDIYKTRPLVSKIFHKSSRSDTVKGFDCVHAVEIDGQIESLWLGEAKFYTNIDAAIRAAATSVKEVIDSVRLRDEFMLISNDIDKETETGQRAVKLLKSTTSLDEITSKICIPVLLAYESPIVGKHTSNTDVYIQELSDEVQAHIGKFINAVDGIEINIHVFTLSMHQKEELVKRFDTQLKGHQADAK